MKILVVLSFVVLMLGIGARESSSSDNSVNNRYTFHDVDSTWKEARNACRENGTHLVTFETTKEWKNMNNLIKERVDKGDSNYTHWYIGLRNESGTWRWVGAGTSCVSITEDDHRWQWDEPNTSSGREFCGEINALYRGQRGHFNNVKCNVRYMAEKVGKPRGYICENY
ncbi:L-selectin-like [Oculina patagonica]